MAWPAWAITHLHSVFFSGAVNVPHGANLLSNTSGTLVGVVAAPLTWLFGPVLATNVALTLAPALSAWACFAAVRPLVTWKAAAIPAALVFGYSAAIVTSLTFGHVSVTVLVIPPFLFTTLYEIVIRQEHSVRRDGLAARRALDRAVLHFARDPRHVSGARCGGLGDRRRRGLAPGPRPAPGTPCPALALAGGLTLVVLAYPTWFGLAGPESVSGVLFALAPISGIPLSGLLAPGQYAAQANGYIRFGGYLGRTGPPPDFVGTGVALVALGSVIVARRRLLAWLLLFLAAVTFWLALGGYLLGGPAWLGHPWLPWRTLSMLPVLKEILPDQFVPLLTLFVAFLIAVGLDVLHHTRWQPGSWSASHRNVIATVATIAVAVVAVSPVFATFEAPLRVVRVHTPAYLRSSAPTVPDDDVVLTVPFAVTGSTQPMLWQATQGMHFRLAGAALKTPNGLGGPIGTGAPGSARRILTDLTIGGSALPTGTVAQLAVVRQALPVVAGRSGGHHWFEPRPGLRVRVLHRSHRYGAHVRAGRLGVEDRFRGAFDADGHWYCTHALPCDRRIAERAPGAADDGTLRPLRGRT